MCGIAGIINLDGKEVNREDLKKMTDSIAHRGPDGEGFFTDKVVGFGHRRLAIIDLSEAGKQPMLSNNGRFVLTYNGEIYNYKEIQNDLINLGYKFQSTTDSEVVVNAWQEWGEDCVSLFNGMFAFAIYDKEDQSIFIVRDRYGIKPLYYYFHNNIFLFGSEQKAILANNKSENSLDKKAFFEYLTFQNIFTDRTLNKFIKLLPPASVAKLSINEKRIASTKYWDFHFREPEVIADSREYLGELDRLFQQAVSRQLISDVELGSYLSGGMDSGTITALASKELPYIKTFTCGFDLSSASGVELGFDEREKAEAMSALFKTEHYEMVLKAGDMERCFENIAFHIEEPRVGQSYPNYYAAKLASKFVKVVLSGAGGDELFGGYPWRYYRGATASNFEDYIDKYYVFWQRLIDNKDMKNIFAPIWNEVEDVWTRDIFRDVFLTHENKLETPEDYVNHSLYFEAKTFLHGLLIIEDKLSMAHSLETRVPFLDNDLVDFASQCPVSLKISNLHETLRIDENKSGDKQTLYFEKTNDGKQILRDMMSSYIPDSITKAIKKGFSAPDSSWFKGESIDFVKTILQNPSAKIYSFLDYNSVNELLNEHFESKKNKRLLIWSLLSLEKYFDTK